VRSGDGVERAVNVAKEYVAMAEATCALMPASSATTALRDAAGALLTTISN
jgi:geranylgeranyl pyrophosphate synthase